MSQELYNLLKEGENREIPWHVAAEHLLKLKIASGGLLTEDIRELHEAAMQIKEAGVQSEPISKEELQQAVKSGYLSGVRSTVSGDMARRNAIARKRGERAGKTMGSLAGAAGGALVGGPKHRLTGAALGTLLGYTAGKGIGEEVDARRMRPNVKPLEKNSDFGKEAEAKKDKGPNPVPLLAGGAAAGALAGGGVHAVQRAQALRDVAEALGKKTSTLSHLGKGIKSGTTLKAALTGAGVGALGGAAAHLIRKKMKKKKAEIEKQAQEPMAPIQDEAIPVEAPVVPQLDPMQEAAQQAALAGKMDPVDVLLQAQQALNEAEFFRQKAEEAEMAASQEAERADMAEGQLQQTSEMADQQAQEGAMREEQTAQQAQMATEQAQMASQDSVQARNEALAAQHQNIALRQAVTNFRQSLMDLVAQDPTQLLGPPAAPQGPMPMGPEAGPPPGPEMAPGGPPPPEAGGPPPEMAPPGAPPPGPPMEAPPPPGPPGPPPGPPMGGPPPGPPAA